MDLKDSKTMYEVLHSISARATATQAVLVLVLDTETGIVGAMCDAVANNDTTGIKGAVFIAERFLEHYEAGRYNVNKEVV